MIVQTPLQAPVYPRTHPTYGCTFTPEQSRVPLKGVRHEPQTIEWLWRLFNTLPKKRPQLRNSQTATARLLNWRSKAILPPRRLYASTVDYYEACEPLYSARERFIGFANPTLMRSVMCACRKILPKILF